MQPGSPPIVSGNPRRLDTGNDYDRLQRYSRLITGYSALVSVAFSVLAGFTWSMFPLKQIVPQFVYFSDARDQVVSVDARHISRDTRDLLSEKLIREYVLDRETINNVDEKLRYPRLQRFSSAGVFAAFRQRMDPQNQHSPLRTYRDNGMTREIHVEAVTPTSYSEGIYSVDFVAIDRKDGDEIKRQILVATIQLKFQPIETRPEWAAENPIGLTIAGYEIRVRDLANPETKDTNP